MPVQLNQVILQSRLQQKEYLKTITYLQQQHDLRQKIRGDVRRRHEQLEAWDQKYIMKSPWPVKPFFFNIWKEHQYIASGESVLMIVPPVKNFIAMAPLRVDGAGKVKIGQKALISLSAYPYEEFRLIPGRVAGISPVALDTAFLWR